MIEISVVVPTYNGLQKLPDILYALKQQTFKEFELIIAVDGSTDGTLSYLESVKSSFNNLVIVTQTNKGRASIRNLGASVAKGELLIFFDDDMILETKCIEKHYEHHQKVPGSIMIGGSDELVRELYSDFVDFKIHLNKQWVKPLLKYEKEPLPAHQTYLSAANFSIHKKTFSEIGGFDERLNDAEDYDFGVRAKQLNIPIYYSRKAFAWHNDLINCKTYIKRLRQYRQAHEKLSNCKPELHIELKQAIKVPKGWKKLFFQSFCNKFWISSIDKNYWVWLPKYIRYKLYDCVITANGSFYPNKVEL